MASPVFSRSRGSAWKEQPEHRSDRSRSRLRWTVLAIWWFGVALELPYHKTPFLTGLGNPTVYVIGDSLSAGMGAEGDTWPRILGRRHGLTVVNFSRAGVGVAKAKEMADHVIDPGSLVIVEIGGNDILSDLPPASFETHLDVLLARLRLRGRTVVLLELPLPPSYNRYGVIQRRLAVKHGAKLVPKRVMLRVLTSTGATLDSVHLSGAGHAAMADAIWRIIQPAFDGIERIKGS